MLEISVISKLAANNAASLLQQLSITSKMLQ